MIDTLNVEINNPYPASLDLFMHELDEYYVDIHFYKDGQIFPVSYEFYPPGPSQLPLVKANITVDNVLIVEGLEGEKIPNDNTGVRYNIPLAPGLMKIEFILEDNQNLGVTSGIFIACPPIKIKVHPSILRNAIITPESEGTVADLVRAWPDIETLITDGIEFENLSEGLQTILNQKIRVSFVPTSSSVFNDNTDVGVVYFTKRNDVTYRFFTVPGIDSNDKAQFRFSNTGNIEYRINDGNSWTSFIDILDSVNSRISALESTIGTLNAQLENAINGLNEEVSE